MNEGLRGRWHGKRCFGYHHDLHVNAEDKDIGARSLPEVDVDFRWSAMKYVGPAMDFSRRSVNPEGDLLAVAGQYAIETLGMDGRVPSGPDVLRSYSGELFPRPLEHARAPADVDRYPWIDPAWWEPPDFAALRQRFPSHALVFLPGWLPLFCGASDAFGMEKALVLMVEEPGLFRRFLETQHAIYMTLLRKALPAARGLVDICWLGDDYASQEGMLFDPALWRRYIKPLLSEQVRLAKECDMRVLFHSCGAVRPLLEDFIEIGIDGLLVFQSSAAGMDARSIARDFGGRMVFYGGIDCQRLLTFGTPGQVADELAGNRDAFAARGGYVAANTHHGIANIKGENIEAMCRAAHLPIARDELPKGG